jgi:hypothetical protein
MSASIRPFDDLINFIAQFAPEQVLAFRPSKATIDRVHFLIEKEKADGLSTEEQEELDGYLLQEDLMILAKSRAHIQLQKP